jgi:hypothetical protein
MKPLSKTLTINLLALLGYSIIIFLLFGLKGDYGQYGPGMEIGLLMLYLIAAQAVLNLILAIVYYITKKPKWGGAFLISVPIVLLIGFSFCYGSITLADAI